MTRSLFKPLTHKEIDNFLKRYPDVQFVNCMVVDMLGLIRGKQIKVSKLRELTDPVIALHKSIMLQNSMGENFAIPSLATVNPDYSSHGAVGTLLPALWSSPTFMKGGLHRKKKWEKNRAKSLEKIEGTKKLMSFSI